MRATTTMNPSRKRIVGFPFLKLLLLCAAALMFWNDARAQSVESIPVSFTVQNLNRSQVLCLTDRRTYQIRGRLVGPAGAFAAGGPDALTVYMHGVGWGQFYWNFTQFPDVDYATQMARMGHVSLVYDQLGYGASGRSLGLLNCYGGEADIVNQMIDALRDGDYAIPGSVLAPRSFSRVALASHQAAGLMSQPAAYSFRNVDALIVTGFSDAALSFKPAILTATTAFITACLVGGDRSDGATGPRFYGFFPLQDRRFAALNFANADPAVVARATELRGRAACGELASAFTTVGVDMLQLLLRQVRVPVLLVNGLEDEFFRQPLGANFQKRLYSGSDDVTSELIAGSGQALALERTAPEFRRVMHNWLAPRGF
ncbi:MAG: alpha/beta fold hydrolase [Panacagrimonas sp.]